MNDARTRQTIHIPGTLSADATGVIPMWATRGGTLLEVSACSSVNSPATLMLGVRGLSPDADGIMTAKPIGVSGTPRIFKVADFDGVLADPIRSSCPRFNKETVLTWTLNYNGPGTAEVQLITLTNHLGGTFSLTYSGQVTAGIAYNATAATVQAALEVLNNIAPGDIVVTGPAGGPWTVTFGGTLDETNVAEMTGSAASLTGTNAIQSVTITGAPTGGTFTLTYSGQTTAALAFNISAADLATALKALSNIGPTDVTVTGDAGGPYTVEFVTTMGSQPITAMTADAASLTGGTTPAVVIETTQAGLTPALAVTTSTAGVTGTAAANVDLNFTVLIGGAVSAVTGF